MKKMNLLPNVSISDLFSTWGFSLIKFISQGVALILNLESIGGGLRQKEDKLFYIDGCVFYYALKDCAILFPSTPLDVGTLNILETDRSVKFGSNCKFMDRRRTGSKLIVVSV